MELSWLVVVGQKYLKCVKNLGVVYQGQLLLGSAATKRVRGASGASVEQRRGNTCARPRKRDFSSRGPRRRRHMSLSVSPAEQGMHFHSRVKDLAASAAGEIIVPGRSEKRLPLMPLHMWKRARTTTWLPPAACGREGGWRIISMQRAANIWSPNFAFFPPRVRLRHKHPSVQTPRKQNTFGSRARWFLFLCSGRSERCLSFFQINWPIGRDWEPAIKTTKLRDFFPLTPLSFNVRELVGFYDTMYSLWVCVALYCAVIYFLCFY